MKPKSVPAPRRQIQKISPERLRRSVASSCALESELSVAEIERQLQNRNPQFKHVGLAF